VIASSVLLDSRVALGTLFRIRHQPVRRLGIIGTFLLPELDVFADQRSVITSKAASEIGKQCSTS
jgi:hypothetical protein